MKLPIHGTETRTALHRLMQALPRDELMRITGCTEEAARKWKAGHRTPSVPTLINLARCVPAIHEWLLSEVAIPVMGEAAMTFFAPPSVETVPEDRMSAVYFIQAISGGPIKIGYTKNISQRLATAQTHSPERLIVIASFPGGAAEEGALHWKLKDHRVNGEWYAPAEEVMAEIKWARLLREGGIT